MIKELNVVDMGKDLIRVIGTPASGKTTFLIGRTYLEHNLGRKVALINMPEYVSCGEHIEIHTAYELEKILPYLYVFDLVVLDDIHLISSEIKDSSPIAESLRLFELNIPEHQTRIYSMQRKPI